MKYVNGLTLEITSKCNSMCRYCFSESGPTCTPELTLDDMIKVIDQYIALENKIAYDNSPNKKLKSQLIITGGEFLLHNQWKELFQYLTNQHISFSAASNGILLYQDVIDFINQTSILDLQISLDGLSESDNILRNPSTMKTVIENLKLLSNSPLKNRTTIKTTITKANQHVARDMVNFARSLGFNMVFGFVQILGRASSDHEYVLNSQEIAKFNKQVVENYSDVVLPLMFSHAPCPLDIDDEPLAFRVSSTGDIFPCASFHEDFFKLGNILKTSLKDTLQSDKFHRIQQWVSDRKNIMIHGPCKNCYVSYICQGSCPAASYYEEGDMYLPTKRICNAAKQFNCYMFPKLLNQEVTFADRK